MPSNTESNLPAIKYRIEFDMSSNTEYNFICHQIQNTILYAIEYRIQFYMPSNTEYLMAYKTVFCISWHIKLYSVFDGI